MPRIDDRTEWLETDGLGGFASGTTSGIRTRRYHALLLVATTPPTGRMVLVNGFDAWLDTPLGSFALSTQRYAPGVVHPDGERWIETFHINPWPTWEVETGDGTRVRQEIAVLRDPRSTVVRWQLIRSSGPVTLRVRPFMSGRDYHAMHRENGAFRFTPHCAAGGLAFAPYDGVPATILLTNGSYRHEPNWYRRFLYHAERERGLDDEEDLVSPGELAWRLDGERPHACWMLRAEDTAAVEPHTATQVEHIVSAGLDAERIRRSAFRTDLDRAADAYIVKRGNGRTIIAGYPWFTDWGRDTFIALRGLCLATGRLADARDILLQWSGRVSEGMLPNRFLDRDEPPEFNSVDAALWYVIAVDEFLAASDRESGLVSPADRASLLRAVSQIIEGYAPGTRYGIRLDNDGLLRAGVPGVQLTWMDARVGDRVLTPRIGKPVEIQALWINAVHVASRIRAEWLEVYERGRAAFEDRFWNEQRGHLADVVDVDHVGGTEDDTCRPNQILAVGGLRLSLVNGTRARRIVDTVERLLLTPLGLRSLAPGEPGYAPHYVGAPPVRDAAYHQGIAWPWLLGPFVDAWVRVRGDTAEARQEAHQRFVVPLLAHLDEAGLGHVSEIADGEPPFTPRGCPFQAWSLGELIRIQRRILHGDS